jgi:hypothetical protein
MWCLYFGGSKCTSFTLPPPAPPPPPPLHLFVFARLMMRMQELFTRVEKKMDDGKKS